MNWIKMFNELLKDDKNYYPIRFFEPITKEKLEEITDTMKITITGDILELLQQTDGIFSNTFGGYLVLSSKKIIDCYIHHLMYLKEIDNTFSNNYMFFADNGCGEYFGYEVCNGKIKSNQIGIYYPIENEYRIVAPNLYTWATEWYTGKLST